MGDERQAKTYVELGQAAMKAREGNLYRLWTLARACDTAGRGSVSLPALKAFTSPYFSAQTLMRTIKAGGGLWWDTSWPGMLKLRSLRIVAGRLGSPLHYHPVYIPLDYFKRIGDFSAAMMMALMAGKPRTISQTTMAGLYGRKLRTISGYVKMCKQRGLLTVQPQAMLTHLAADAGNYPELAAKGYFLTYVNGKRCMAKRIPNQYTANLDTAPFGQVKSIGQASLTTTGAHWRRLYFTEESKGLHRTMAGLAEGETLYVAGPGVTDDGIRLWRGYERQPGGPVIEL